MATKGKISELYDVEAIKAQQSQVVGYVDEFVRKVSETKPIKVKLEGAEKTKDLLKGMTDLGLATKEYARIIDSTATGQAKLNAMQSDAAKKQAEVRIEIQEQNKALKEEIQLNQAAEGSINQKKVQLNQLQRQYDALSEAQRNSDEGTGLLKSIQDLDKGLKDLEGSTGRFQRNVGNYSGAIKVLEQGMKEAKDKLDAFVASGKQDEAVLETLQKEYGLLQTLVDAQSEGFKNATSEIRNNQRAILLLSQIYGEDSAIVQELIGRTAELTDTVGDLKAQVKARSSDTQVFDGLINAAQGVAGSFAIAQGTAALFGDQSEEMQKTLVKLNAAMSILQGLQSIQNILQKESAVRGLISVGVQKLLNIQTTLQTAAESRSIAIRYAAAAAQKALNFAMSAAGGPILAILGIIGLLIASFSSFGATTKSATLDLKKFNDEIELGAKFAEQNQKEASQRNALAISESKKKFEAEQNARDLEKKGLQDQLAIQEKYITDNQANEVLAVKYQTDARNKRIKLDEDEFNKVAESLLKLNEARKKAAEIRNQIAIKENENARTSAVEGAQVRRAEVDLTVSDLNTRADALRRIASDETKSYAVRIKASDAFYNQQIRIIELQKKQALDNPELKPEERAKIINDAANKEIVITRDSAKAKLDYMREDAARERKARLDILKTELDDQAKANELIADNEKKSFDDRFNAAYASYNKRSALIKAQHDEDLKVDEVARAKRRKGEELTDDELFKITKLTTEERLAIETKYTSDVNQLTVDYGLKQLELYKVNQEQITALIEQENQKRKDIIDGNQANDITALNKQFADGKIAIEEYNRQRTAIETKYSVESLQNEVRNAFAKVLATKTGTAARFEAEKELAEKTQALSDATTQKQKDNAIKLAELQKQAAEQAYSTITAIVDAQFDNQKNKVQKQIDASDAQKEADINTVNASIDTEENKANKIAIINARAAAQKEALERRQRQIDIQKAKFDKAANIAKIIADTAAAVVAQLKAVPGHGGIVLAQVVAAIGALQLATAIATPIPQFKHGTEDAPGGAAWVGDGGKKETVITPDGRVMITPAKPTLWNIPKHSVVLPDTSKILDYAIGATHANILAATAHQPPRVDIAQLITKQFEKEGSKIVNAILNKRELKFHWNNGELQKSVKRGNDTYNYLHDNLDF